MLRTSATGEQNGFTLLEMLVVVAIVALIASALPLALNHTMPGRRVALALLQIGAVIQEAKNLSTASATPVRIAIDKHSVAILRGTGLRSEHLPHTTRRASFASTLYVSGFQIDGQPESLCVVYPDGSVQGGRIEVEDTGHKGEVRLSPITGRISVSRLF